MTEIKVSFQGQFRYESIRDLSGEITTENPIQRVPDPAKVKIIKDSLLAEMSRLKLDEVIQTGIIQIGKLEGKTYILDGQHRFQAYKELNSPNYIYIQSWSFLSIEEMRKKFIEINSNTPLESYIMDITLPQVQKSAYDVLIDYVQNTYKAYISTADTPKYPNINIQKFRSIIDLIPQLKEYGSKDIISKFEEWNKVCLEELKNHKRKPERERYTESVAKGYKLFINRTVTELLHKKIS